VDTSDLEGLNELLRGNHSLYELDMSCNYMKEAGAVAFSEVLDNNYTLKRLDLEDNHIADGSINDKGIAALANSLKDHPSVYYVNLRQNSIGAKGSEALLKMMEENQMITTLEVLETRPNAMVGNTIKTEVAQRMNELVLRNKEEVITTARYLKEKAGNIGEKLDLERLKHYQRCDHGLLESYLGAEDYGKMVRNVERYIAMNFLEVIGCKGNGKSEIERMPYGVKYEIFSYLELDKVLWREEAKKKQKEREKRNENLGDKDGGNCNIW